MWQKSGKMIPGEIPILIIVGQMLTDGIKIKRIARHRFGGAFIYA